MKRVALVVDGPDTVFYRIAQAIKLYSELEVEYEICIEKGAVDRISRRDYLKAFDLIHLFWRMQALSFSDKNSKQITTCFYDHLLVESKLINKMIKSRVKDIYFSSNKLKNQIFAHHGWSGDLCPDGVDIRLFGHQGNLSVSSNSEIRVGWVGNSTWGTHDHKGLKSIFEPVRNRLVGKGFSFHPLDSSREKTAFAKMPKFYESIDVLMCTSKSEGTPNPILEAAASGCAWVSTDVGIVREFAGEQQKAFIVPRSIDDFESALLKLQRNRNLLEICKRENVLRVQGWSWERSVRNHDKFFARNLDSN